MKKESSLERNLEKDNHSFKKIALEDTLGNVTYSLIAGGALDYFVGLNFQGIIASRLSATGINLVTASPYGFWREKVFKLSKTNEKSTRIRKALTDLFAFNTFQVPVYATVISIGSFISEGKVNLEEVRDGSIYLATISPLIGPTSGWYMDKIRKLVGVKSAVEGAYK